MGTLGTITLPCTEGIINKKGELAGVDGAAAHGADLADDLVRVHAKLDRSEGGEERGETQAGEAMDGDGFAEAVETGDGRGVRVRVRAQVGVRRGRREAGSGAGDVVVQAKEVVKQGEPGGDKVGRRGCPLENVCEFDTLQLINPEEKLAMA